MSDMACANSVADRGPFFHLGLTAHTGSICNLNRCWGEGGAHTNHLSCLDGEGVPT